MAITTDPTEPAVGEEVTLSITSASGNVVVFGLTSVPDSSELEVGLLLDESDDPPTSAMAAASAGLEHDAFTPDVPGEYGITAFDIRKHLAAGEPFAERRFSLLGTQTGTVHVLAYVRMPIITAAGHGATLRLGMLNETIETATLVDPTTELARAAALDSTVTAALAALAGSSVGTIMGVFVTRVEDLRGMLRADGHYDDDDGHIVTDTTNEVDRRQASVDAAAIHVLNECGTSLEGHLRAGAALVSKWHTNDDGVNYPLAPPARSLGTAQVRLSDLRERVYERHRILGSGATPPVHDTVGGDTTNVLTAPTLFDAVVVAFFDALASAAPTAVAGEPEGAVDAEHLGFEREI